MHTPAYQQFTILLSWEHLLSWSLFNGGLSSAQANDYTDKLSWKSVPHLYQLQSWCGPLLLYFFLIWSHRHVLFRVKSSAVCTSVRSELFREGHVILETPGTWWQCAMSAWVVDKPVWQGSDEIQINRLLIRARYDWYTDSNIFWI